MKKIITMLLLLVVVTISRAQTAHQSYIQKSPNKIVVTTATSKKLIKQVQQGKAYLIDVRTPEEYNAGHLQYAQNINIKAADFNDKVNKLDKSKPVYLYCHSGNRSGKATDSLQTLGYKHSYNIGALDSIAKAGFPLQQ